MKYPSEIIVEGISIPINTDFRIGIEFERIMQVRSIEKNEKSKLVLSMYFKEIPKLNDYGLLIDELMKFYTCGKERIRVSESEEETPYTNHAYDFEYDWNYIQAAFIQQYRIELNTIDYMHWWQFRGMFEALTEDTQIKKIIGFRLMEIDPKMSKEQKKYYREMKRVYRLPDKRTEEEIENDFASGFC